MLTKTAVRIAALLLAAAVPAWSAGLVKLEDGLLTMQVRNMPLRDILQQIANQADVEIVAQDVVIQAVSADFSRTAIEEALRRLTQDFNSVFLYGPKRMNKVLLYAKNASTGGKAEIKQEVFRPGASKPPPSPLPQEKPTVVSEFAEDTVTAEADEESVVELAKSDDPALREEAVGMLADMEDGSGIKQLSEMLLHDEDSGIRQLIADVFGGMDDQKVVPTLGKALNDKDADVRSMVVYALGQIGGDEAVALIKTAQKDKSQAVRDAAADALEMTIENE